MKESIYNRIIRVPYSNRDLKIKKFEVKNYSYRRVETAVIISVWNNDCFNKQTIHFEHEDFVELMMSKEEGEYIYPETANALIDCGMDINEALEYDLIHKDEVEQALKWSCNRIKFLIDDHVMEQKMYSGCFKDRQECARFIIKEQKGLVSQSEMIDRFVGFSNMPTLQDAQ